MNVEQYKYAFAHLRRGTTKQGPAPHKSVLLLAVIHEFESGRITENKILLSESLENSFMRIWQTNIHSGHIANIALPFFHLQSEGFWQLHAYPQWTDWLIARESVNSVKKLRQAVQYASLNEDLFELLMKSASRAILKEVLTTDFICDTDIKTVERQAAKKYLEEQITMTRYSHYGMGGKASSLQRNLDERYKDFFCIVQELLQNADDAGASQVIIGQLDSLSDEHALCNVPGVFILNNGPVSDSDLDHIFSIADSNKGAEEDKIGKFGLGMKSVFHLCESFFIFGHQAEGVTGNIISDLFDPWDNENDITIMPPPHDAWRKSFNENQLKLWEDVRRTLGALHDFGDDWFALWLPLRQRNQCNDGKMALLDYYPLEANAKEWFTDDDFRKVSGMMPFFKHLRKISFVSGNLARFGSLELLPENESSFSGNSSNEWSGIIISDKQILGKQIYHGWEFFGHKELEELRSSSPPWPTVQQFDCLNRTWIEEKDKTAPHAAICYCTEELPKNSSSGNLVLQECVFLPLSEMRQHIALQLPYNITISFHGQYFVDGGRHRYRLEDDKMTDSIKMRWNNILRSQLLLPQVLPTLAAYFAQYDIHFVESFLRQFLQTDFWRSGSKDICRKEQYVLCLTEKGWNWQCTSTEKNFLLLPDVSHAKLLMSLFNQSNKGYLFVLNTSPRASMNAPMNWQPDHALCFWNAINAQDEKERYSRTILDFIENSRNEIKTTEGQLQKIKEFLLGISMAQYRSAREQLGRIFRGYPHRDIQFPKDNLTTASFDLWKSVFSCTAYCMPLDLPKDENNTFAYSLEDLQQMLPEIEKQLKETQDGNCKGILRHLVCDLFRNGDVTADSRLAVYKLFVFKDDERLSLNQLIQLYEDHLLYREGGDITTMKATQKAIKIKMVSLSAFYCDALKNIQLIEAFSYRNIPAIFSKCPLLNNPEDRADLLKEIKGKQNGNGEFFHVVRYLLHGLPEYFDYLDEIAIPNIAENSQHLFEMGLHLQKLMLENIPAFNIPAELIDLMSFAEMKEFGIKQYRIEDIINKVSQYPLSQLEDNCSRWRSDSSWKILLENLSIATDVKAVAKLPIWPCYGDFYSALDASCFLEDDVFIPEQLVRDKYVKKLDIVSAEDQQLLREKISGVKTWNDSNIIDYCTRYDKDNIYVEDLLEVLDAHREGLTDSDLEKLYVHPLLQIQSGKYVAYYQVLPSFSYNKCQLYDSSALTQTALTYWKKLSEFQKENPQRRALFLIQLLQHDESVSCGKLPEGLCKASRFKEVFQNSKTMPILGILRDLEEKIDCEYLLGALNTHISDQRLAGLCCELTHKLSQENNDDYWDYLCYLTQRITYSGKCKTILKKTMLPNKLRVATSCSELTCDTYSIDDKYILHPKLQKFFQQKEKSDKELSELNKLPMYTDDATYYNSVQYNNLLVESAKTMDQYFGNWPDELSDSIGAFLLLTGKNSGLVKLAQKFTKQNQDLLLSRLSTDAYNKIGKYTTVVKVYEGNDFKVRALTEDILTVPLQQLSETATLLVGDSKKNCCLSYNIHTSEDYLNLSLRSITVDDPEIGLSLLINTAKEILDRGFGLSNEVVNKVSTLFKDVQDSGQFDLKNTRTIILKKLPYLLSLLSLSGKSILSQHRRKCEQKEELVTQAENQENKKLEEQYRAEEKQAQYELGALLDQNKQLQEETLSAIRKRISTEEYGYSQDSIPFELFQNADDAAVELQNMKSISAADKTVIQPFAITLDKDALTVVHWGRPINQYKYPGFSHERGENLGYQADLKKMLLMGISDKGEEELQRTGKYGLGFKSVHLITNTPFITSNSLNFSICGGLLPTQASTETAKMLKDIVTQYTRECMPDDRETTAFHLPLNSDVRDTLSINRFLDAAPLLIYFSRKINSIYIKTKDKCCNYSLKDPELEPRFEVWDLDTVQLAIGLCNNLPAMLPEKLRCSTIWVTVPTQIQEKIGFAVNGDFRVDVGRNHLHKAEENEQIAQKGANALLKKLKGLEKDRKYWEALWRLFTNDGESGYWNALRTRPEVRQVLIPLLWGTLEEPAGYGAFIKTSPAIPSYLSGKYNEQLLSLNDIKYTADENLTKYWDLFVDIAEGAGQFAPGEIVNASVKNALEHIYGKTGIRNEDYNIPRLMKKCQFLSPEHINNKTWRAFVENCRLYQSAFGHLRFLNQNGDLCQSSNLLISNNNDDEAKRAAFAPAAALLSKEYDDEAACLFKFSRGKMNSPVEVLGKWAIEAQTDVQREAVCDYLLNGELHAQLIEYLCANLPEKNWLEEWHKERPNLIGLAYLFLSKQGEFSPMSAQDTERDYADNNVQNETGSEDDETDEDNNGKEDDQTSQRAQEAQNEPDTFWKKTENRWKQSKDSIIRNANLTLYDTAELMPFPLVINTVEDRERWMTLFILAASRSMGRQTQIQHRDFIKWCRQKGYWDIFVAPEIQIQDWIKVIDAHIETNDSTYAYWLSLYPKIYFFAKYMRQYVELFKHYTKKNHPPVTWNNLTCFRNNYTYRGYDIQMPDLRMGLGNIGIHFLLRELWRSNTLRPAGMEQFCIVTSSRNRELFSISTTDGSNKEANGEWSVEMYNKLKKHVSDPTFDGHFDIAFQ